MSTQRTTQDREIDQHGRTAPDRGRTYVLLLLGVSVVLQVGCGRAQHQEASTQIAPGDAVAAPNENFHHDASTPRLDSSVSQQPPSQRSTDPSFEVFHEDAITAPPTTMLSPARTTAMQKTNNGPVTETLPMQRESQQIPDMPPAIDDSRDASYTTVEVFYATDRARGAMPLSAYEVTGQKQMFVVFSFASVLILMGALACWLRGNSKQTVFAIFTGLATGCGAAAILMSGQANIEKHGVTYTSDRGILSRGICEVTVPRSHAKGVVERPNLFRFEFRENQDKHIVMTSAVELTQSDFSSRLAHRIAGSPQQDALVFIHGYNVDFESAIQRTAQVSVDLPFEGVPICYTWPSQGSLLGYTIDENNSEWTITHLREFLLELARDSGASSINVIAHSMGNRAMVAAMSQIQSQADPSAARPFDRLVMAAPDVDADRFVRDFASPLAAIANHVTLYASSDDQALVASKQVHGYPRAGDSGVDIVVVPGIETVDVSGIDLSILGHSYYGDNEAMLRELYGVVRERKSAPQRASLITRRTGNLIYWQLGTDVQAQMPMEVRR
ncbi:hypothetical protein Poly51_57070 [Rubripirellula tenax]|uniref:Alpha/beta hydrolase family protein n=1 Tax=Rubripirellula tenax TaxID=2528015 RepID=A0A5C6EF44_9BACT|nr:alpha/beta hydrolase [Rubripirellula tenax]TWU46311.1 hypothetical protein Poly51_57070 [Rubripirellula tenax]